MHSSFCAAENHGLVGMQVKKNKALFPKHYPEKESYLIVQDHALE